MNDDIEQQLTTPSPPNTRLTKVNLSRRSLLAWLLGIATLEAVASGITWKSLVRKLREIILNQPPLGTFLYQYGVSSSPVYAVAWSPDGNLIASAGFDNTVQIWNASTGQLLFRYTGHTDSVHAVAWSPDGNLIASAGSDNTVRIWDPSTGQTLYKYARHAASVNAVAWSPDGQRIASASSDRTVQEWQAI